MENIFNTYIKRYLSQPFERLFDKEHAKLINGHYINQAATLYAIVEVPKISYIPQSFYPIDNYCFVGQIETGGKNHTVMINVAKTWYETESPLSADLRKRFESLEDFTNYSMSKFSTMEGSNLSNQEKYRSLAEVNVHSSTSDHLSIQCPIAIAGSNGKHPTAELPIYQIVNMFDIDCIEQVETIYIGMSEAGTFNRLRKHDKWGEIMANQNPNCDYLVYFFELDDSQIVKDKLQDVNILIRDDTYMDKKSIAQLCEASLINFYKPRHNRQHKHSDIKQADIVKSKLLAKGYNQISTEVELSGILGRLGTGTRPYQQ